jgi:hypothetical protein
MALPPKDTIKPPPPPPKSMVQTTIKEAFKHYMIWGLLYLFIIEVISYFYWSDPQYKDFFYPLLTQIAFVVLLTNFLALHKRLNFCKFKKFSIVSMILYYVYAIFAMIFKIESFIENIHYSFVVLSFGLFVWSYTKCVNKNNRL